MAVNFLSINAKGLNSPFKRSMLWKDVRTCGADIVCVQETHFKSSSPLRLQNRSFPHVFAARSEKKKAGVLVAIKDSVTFLLHRVCVDPGGRFIILLCDINNETYTIVNIYAPNSRQISFLHKIWRKVERVKKGHIIWCGDFNAIVDPTIDTTSTSSTPPTHIHSWLSASII